MSEQPEPQPTEIDYSEIQEQFSDLIGIHINPWSASIDFGIRSTRLGTDPHKMINRMRMPLQQAKALAVLLLRDIRTYEQRTGADIGLPSQVLQELNIPLEDWERYKGV